ncbi:MAG: hypothetical protein RR064_06365, partial [Oscillospiraceae bacterium]
LQKALSLVMALIMILGIVVGAFSMGAMAADFVPTLGSNHTITLATPAPPQTATINVMEEKKGLVSTLYTTAGTYGFKVVENAGVWSINNATGNTQVSGSAFSNGNKTVSVGGAEITKFLGATETAWANGDTFTIEIVSKYGSSNLNAEPVISNRKITYPDKNNQFSSISRNRRADVHLTITDTNIVQADYDGGEQIMMATGSSFKFDEKSSTYIREYVSSNGFVSFDVVFQNVVYTGTGNSVKYRLLYNAKSGKRTYDSDVVFSEYRFHEYKEPSDNNSGDSSEPTLDPLVPHMIIDSYNYGGKNATAGETIKLKMTIKNTSNEFNLENIVMKITPPEAFSIASSSNTFYITGLGKDEIMEKEIEIQVKADAKPESHNIKIDFTYQYSTDKARKESTSEENIAIPVSQIDRFSINSVDAPATLYIGDEYPMSASLINKGKSAVFNVSAEFKTADNSQNQTQFIGNIESGKEASADFFVSGKEPGEIKGEIVITYEDANSNIKTLSRLIDVVVEGDFYNPNPDEGMIVDPIEPVVPVDVKPDNTVKYVLIFCGIVIVGITTFTTVMKIKVQRSEFADEDI